MTDPRHPYARVALEVLRVYQRSPDLPHPFYLSLLRRQLCDLTPTGGSYVLKGDNVWSSNGYTYQVDAPTEWRDEGLTHDAEERACDEPGHHLSSRVVGAPFYHPLRKDADVQLTRLMDFYDTYRGRLRLATDAETAALRADRNASFIPDIRPLGRPATAADVKAGLAVFHQDGKGRTWTGPSPTQVSLKADAKEKRPPVGLVVQVEADADGKAVYGVIFRHGVRKVRADEVAP